MKNIQYLKGDATNPQEPGHKIIVHICNDMGAWGSGFVLAVSKKWKEPELQYRKGIKNFPEKTTQDGFRFYDALGKVQFVPVAEELTVANLVGQHLTIRQGDRSPVRYEAIAEGLARIAEEAIRTKSSVHMPRIGCGLAGGSWDQIEPLINETLSSHDIPVTVYDL